MNNKSTSTQEIASPKITDTGDGCELSLSADNQWLRLVVAGKQVASFHVDYVQKVLGAAKDSKDKHSTSRNPELPANL